MAEPTGGVKLDPPSLHHNHSARDSISSNKANSSQITSDSREATPDNHHKPTAAVGTTPEQRKKSSSSGGLVSWIRRKFAKVTLNSFCLISKHICSFDPNDQLPWIGT